MNAVISSISTKMMKLEGESEARKMHLLDTVCIVSEQIDDYLQKSGSFLVH